MKEIICEDEYCVYEDASDIIEFFRENLKDKVIFDHSEGDLEVLILKFGGGKLIVEYTDDYFAIRIIETESDVEWLIDYFGDYLEDDELEKFKKALTQ